MPRTTRTLRAFIRNSVEMWRTTLQANFKQTVQVIIKCEIYQRDAVTPLLFCISLCSRKVTKRGKVVRNEGIALPEVSAADIVDRYKYLRIPQENGKHEEASWKTATK